jgi:hypothetical protein
MTSDTSTAPFTRAGDQPDPSYLLEKLDYSLPVIGFYDAPDPAPFEPLTGPKPGPERGPCVFKFYPRWLKGETLILTPDNYGCRGGGRALCGAEMPSREAFIDFLWGDEGLKAGREQMAVWIDNNPVYEMEHDQILIGPLKPGQYRHLRSITFWVNADQLSVLTYAVYYHHHWGDPPPFTAPFGSGCSQLIVPLGDLDRPLAALGATDIAMRDCLPPDLLAFTVTVPMFERLCSIGPDSFLGKNFLERLRKARKGSLA